MPFEIIAGISGKLEHAPLRWHLTFQDLQRLKSSYSKTSISSTDRSFKETTVTEDILHHVNIGAELFPEKIITIRVGYNFRRAFELSTKDVTGFSGWATGVGIRFKKFRLDYSYSRYTNAGNTSLFGIQFAF